MWRIEWPETISSGKREFAHRTVIAKPVNNSPGLPDAHTEVAIGALKSLSIITELISMVPWFPAIHTNGEIDS